jgi:HSP20 family protein
MWENEESDIFDETERRIDSILAEIYSGSINWLYDLRKNLLRPLYRVEIRDRELIVTFDLPGTEREDITISATENTLSIQAAMKKPVKLMVGGHLQKHVEFEKYAESIRLPVKIDPDKAKATSRNGRLRVRFPLAPHGKSVRVE